MRAFQWSDLGPAERHGVARRLNSQTLAALATTSRASHEVARLAQTRRADSRRWLDLLRDRPNLTPARVALLARLYKRTLEAARLLYAPDAGRAAAFAAFKRRYRLVATYPGQELDWATPDRSMSLLWEPGQTAYVASIRVNFPNDGHGHGLYVYLRRSRAPVRYRVLIEQDGGGLVPHDVSRAVVDAATLAADEVGAPHPAVELFPSSRP